MKVLIVCEESGRVREAFRALGHDAISCDLLPSALPGPHVQGDARPLLRERWDLVIAHPPCTYLCNSGVRWLRETTGTLVRYVGWCQILCGLPMGQCTDGGSRKPRYARIRATRH